MIGAFTRVYDRVAPLGRASAIATRQRDGTRSNARAAAAAASAVEATRRGDAACDEIDGAL
jgi:hypothetical protein